MPDERLPLVEMANQAILDRLAWRASTTLTQAGVPHALIKGVTTARWLYDPPRIYRDVDLLLPLSSLPTAVKALEASGVAAARAGSLGEEASHSLVLVAAAGRELDLHVTLPTLPTPSPRASEALWSVLADRLVEFPLEDGTVPTLDPAGRTILLAMHLLGSHDSPRCQEDLRRAAAHLGEDGLPDVLSLADRLGVAGDVRTAFKIARGDTKLDGDDVPEQLRLRLAGAHSATIRLASILQRPRGRIAPTLLRELFPSRDMILRQSDGAERHALPRLYVQRWLWAARAFPGAVAELRRALPRRRRNSERVGR